MKAGDGRSLGLSHAQILNNLCAAAVEGMCQVADSRDTPQHIAAPVTSYNEVERWLSAVRFHYFRLGDELS